MLLLRFGNACGWKCGQIEVDGVVTTGGAKQRRVDYVIGEEDADGLLGQESLQAQQDGVMRHGGTRAELTLKHVGCGAVVAMRSATEIR